MQGVFCQITEQIVPCLFNDRNLFTSYSKEGRFNPENYLVVSMIKPLLAE